MNHGPATADLSINNMPYLVPERQHERHNVAAHIPTTTHRAPGANQNGFIIEQFADEMALAGGWDPLEWRLEMTKDEFKGWAKSVVEAAKKLKGLKK